MRLLWPIIYMHQFRLGLSTADCIPENEWLALALDCGPAEHREILQAIADTEAALADGTQRDAETLADNHKALHCLRTLSRMIEEENRLIEEDDLASRFEGLQR